MAVPVIQSSTTASIDSDNTLVINKPSGLSNSEMLVGSYAAESSSVPTNTLPSGFSSIVARQDSWGLVLSLQGSRKLITDAAGEPASYTFDQTGAGTEFGAFGVMCRISNVNFNSPVNTSTSTTGTSTTMTFNGVTTTVNDCLILLIGYYLGGVVSGSTAPTQVPSGASAVNSTISASNDEFLVVYSASKATAGSTGNYTVTVPSGAFIWSTLTVAIAPSPIWPFRRNRTYLEM